MPKRMSKTLADEIARRTLEVVNPANRAIALNAALHRHGFTPAGQPAQLTDVAEVSAWLLATFAR